jgi:hypothetical protein
LAAYATENILAQTLCDALYLNNPSIANYVASNQAIGLSSIADFSKADIAVRSAIYVALSQQIWQSP